MRAKCFTLVPEHELVKMAVGGFEYDIRKKLVNKLLRDIAQLADKGRQIEQLKLERQKYSHPERSFRKDKVAYADLE